MIHRLCGNYFLKTNRWKEKLEKWDASNARNSKLSRHKKYLNLQDQDKIASGSECAFVSYAIEGQAAFRYYGIM